MRVEGVVTHFDGAQGFGWLTTDGGDAYFFHCVSIADGSRVIPTGVRAAGERVVGLRGRDEVTAVYALG